MKKSPHVPLSRITTFFFHQRFFFHLVFFFFLVASEGMGKNAGHEIGEQNAAFHQGAPLLMALAHSALQSGECVEEGLYVWYGGVLFGCKRDRKGNRRVR